MRASRKAFSTCVIVTGLLAGSLTFSSTTWAKTHNIAMTAVETDVVIDGSGEKYAAWTFDGTVRDRSSVSRKATRSISP